MSWKGLLILNFSILLHRLFLTSNAFLIRFGYGTINHSYNIQRGLNLITYPYFRFNSISKDDNDDEEDDDDEDEDGDTIIAYKNRSLSWTKRYRALLPYEYARRRVLSLGLQSKSEWDEYVSEGKRGNGAYLPNRPDLMYATEWQGWDEFLSLIRSYTETRHMVQHILKLHSRLTYEVFIYENPKRAELLRIPALPWIVYENKGWINDEHFFGCVTTEEEMNQSSLD